MKFVWIQFGQICSIVSLLINFCSSKSWKKSNFKLDSFWNVAWNWRSLHSSSLIGFVWTWVQSVRLEKNNSFQKRHFSKDHLLEIWRANPNFEVYIWNIFELKLESFQIIPQVSRPLAFGSFWNSTYLPLNWNNANKTIVVEVVFFSKTSLKMISNFRSFNWNGLRIMTGN